MTDAEPQRCESPSPAIRIDQTMNREELYKIRVDTFKFICGYGTRMQALYVTVVAVLTHFALTDGNHPTLFYSLLGIAIAFCTWALYGSWIHYKFALNLGNSLRDLATELNIDPHGEDGLAYANYVRTFFIFQPLVIVGLFILMTLGPIGAQAK